MLKKFTLGLLLLATAHVQAQAKLDVPYQRFIMPNGLNVVLHEDHTTPTVSVNIWYHTGSGSEKPGRTGFAHLFEHVLFEGSKNVPEGGFDQWLEAAGGNNNGSTNPDRTNYYEDLPANALELALFLESDRMGYMLEAMTPGKVDGQRDVVKNERRERYENSPYGLAFPVLGENLYQANHPYHWPTIGYMDDLNAASFEDVVEFFRKYYTPANASLVIAGDIDPVKTRQLVEKWFSEVQGRPRPEPLDFPPAVLTKEKRLVLEDRVQLPRVYMAWLTPPKLSPGDAEMDVVANVLAGGKNSRLYKRLVYEMQIAQDVSAFQSSREASSFFCVIATARDGHTLAELEKVVQEEIDKLKAQPPELREVQRVINQYEAAFLSGLELVSNKSDQLNDYYKVTGNPDYFNEDLSRYLALEPDDVRSAVLTFLKNDGRVILSIVPKGKLNLAAEGSKQIAGERTPIN